MSCIQQTSSNLFPFDKRPSSIVATSSLIVAVALAVLIGLACYFNWGVPVIGSLAAACGASVIVALAIILCKRKVPEEVFPSEAKFVPEVKLKENEQLAEQLYGLAKNDNLKNFQEAVKASPSPVLYDACFKYLVIRPNNADENYSLFNVLILESKWEHVRAILKRIEPKSIDYLALYQHEILCKLNNETLLLLLMKKMSDYCRANLLSAALHFFPASETCFSLGINIYGSQIWITEICRSKLPPDKQLEYIKIIATLENTTLLKLSSCISFNLNPSTFAFIYDASVLHAAVNAGNLQLVSLLLKEGVKVNKTNISGITPLLLAIMKSDIGSVKILLQAGADPKKAMSTEAAKHYISTLKITSEKITPLELAQSLQLTEIADLLTFTNDKS